MGAADVASDLEWELFARPRTLHGLVGDGLPEGTDTIELTRDAGYSLTGSFSGFSPSKVPLFQSAVAGTPITGGEIRGTDGHHNELVVSGVIARSHTTQMVGRDRGRFDGKLTVQNAFLDSGSTRAARTVLVEWYLNGPTEQGVFFRPTRRNSDVRLVRARHVHEERPQPTAVASHSSRGTSVDHALVDIGQYQFIVAAVPRGYGPSWSHSLSIEYRADLGAIPDESTREVISEAISFVLGRQLLLVGATEMDDNGNPILAEGRSPWGDGVVDLCGEHSVPPVHVYDLLERPFEPIASALTRSYLANRERFGLKSAIWNYWLARRAPIGPNLVFIAAAMESLMKGWFASGQSLSGGLDMPEDEFVSLLAPELDIVRQKLNAHATGARTAGRIRRAFMMGVNDRFEAFFAELGITLTPLESAAIRRRNISAHGGGVASDVRRLSDHLKVMEEMHETQAQYRAYETLFHRVVLKLLKHRGTYVDYTSLEHPSRDLGTNAPVPRAQF